MPLQWRASILPLALLAQLDLFRQKVIVYTRVYAGNCLLSYKNTYRWLCPRKELFELLAQFALLRQRSNNGER